MSFDVGALVKVRGREWVVLPESNEDENMLILRPLGGTEDEVTGIYLPLEMPESAENLSKICPNFPFCRSLTVTEGTPLLVPLPPAPPPAPPVLPTPLPRRSPRPPGRPPPRAPAAAAPCCERPRAALGATCELVRGILE